MNRPRMGVLLASCIAFCLVWSRGAAGQPPSVPEAPSERTSSRQEAASAHFRRGVQLYQEGAYRAALVELEKAHETLPNYRILFNVGQVRLDLHDYLGAVQAYEAYLAQGGAEVPSTRRALVTNQIAALRERVGHLTITADQDGAELFVDDVRVGVSPLAQRVAVNVGSHRVVAQTASGVSAVRNVNLAGGESVTVVLTLPAPKPEEPPIAPVPVVRGSERPKRLIIAAFGLGGALVAGAVVSGVQARRAQGRLDARLGRAPVDPDDVGEARDAVQLHATLTDALGGAALGVLVAGTVGWVLWQRRSERSPGAPSVAVGSTGPHVFVEGRF